MAWHIHPASLASTRKERDSKGIGRFCMTIALMAIVLPHTLYAQQDSASTATPAGIEYHKETPDSVHNSHIYYFYFRPATVKIDQLYHPTLSPTGIEFSDMLDAFNGNYYIGKGVVGHPHIALYPSLGESIATQLQPDPNIGYAKRLGNIRFYQAQSPYTLLGYHSSANNDYVVKFAHTQNILPGWNVALDYRLICPDGVYTSSEASNHYLDASTNYFSADSRLQARGGVIWQSMKIDENGGILDDSYFTEQRLSNRAGVPVNLYNSGTVHKELAAFGGISYNLVRQFEHYRNRDSISLTQLNDSTVIADTITLTDTLRVGKPRVLNLGVIGMDINYDRRKRVFTDSTLWRDLTATLYWTNDAYADHRWRNPLKITVGLRPHIVSAVVEGDTMRLRSWLDPFARTEIALGRHRLYGQADMRASFNDAHTPDHRFMAGFDFAFDTLRQNVVNIEVVGQQRMPDLRMLYDQWMIDDGTLKAIQSQHYKVGFKYGQWFDIEAKVSHLSHHTWYDSIMAICEGNEDLWVYQSRINLHLQYHWLHLDMQHLLQYSTDSVQMPLPLLATKNSLYADFSLFRKAVRVQIGTDIRYHSPFFSPSYDPATGLFYHQSQQRVGGYLWADLFLNLQVKRASFYIKGGHINALWDTAPNYFLLPHYPGQKFGLFWGIDWRFFD